MSPFAVELWAAEQQSPEGANEIEGIAPDVAADWATLEAEEVPRFLEKLFEKR